MSPEKWNTDVQGTAFGYAGQGYAVAAKIERSTLNSRLDAMLTQAGSISGVLSACIEKVEGPSPNGDCSQTKQMPQGIESKLNELQCILNEIDKRMSHLCESL